MTTWTDLLDEIQHLRTSAYDVACDLTEEGKDDRAERAFGRVDAYDEVLRRMAATGGE